MSEARTQRSQSPVEPPQLLGRMGGGPRQFGKVEHAKDRRGTIRRLWGYLKHQRNALILTAAMVVVTTALNVLGPYLLGLAIDKYVLTHDLPGLAWICLLMLAAYALNALLTWLQSYVMAGAAQRTIRDLRADLFKKLQSLPLRFFDQRAHGDLMSRLTNDIENVNQVLADGIVQIVSGVLSMIGVAIAMLLINPVLALVSILSITLMSLTVNMWVAPRTRSGFRQQQVSLGKLNGLIEETISGQRVVKAYHREPVVIEQFDQNNRELRKAATRAQIFASLIGPMMNFVGNLGLAVVAGIGGWMAVQGLATVGTIAGFINFSRQFGRPLNELANLYSAIQSAVAGAERVFAIIDETPETDAPDALPLGAIRGDVRFEQVSFGYEPDVPVLKQIDVRAEPGQIIALVGPTGAGKTTIVNLLTRFYEIDSGQILIDSQDIRQIRKTDLRQQLGIVLQDTFLFAGSVMANIRYGRLDASADEVIAAARLANADQFIHRLPQGYETLLSERAGNLSQGQRQLLAIARALLANPSVLILDEATSSVDTRTEQHIQEAMLRLMAGRTSFVIAHRLSTIRDADQILVINHGEVIERGTHTQLLAQHGFYQHLYTSQFRANTRLEGIADS
ncbi:MAG: ABC transporter ATP-binding protein [Roseiflexaceae bacterium]|nr:ABC transporter ATP-binding protein [Roseiflexaceae bacterium]